MVLNSLFKAVIETQPKSDLNKKLGMTSATSPVNNRIIAPFRECMAGKLHEGIFLFASFCPVQNCLDKVFSQ